VFPASQVEKELRDSGDSTEIECVITCEDECGVMWGQGSCGVRPERGHVGSGLKDCNLQLLL